MHIEGKALCLGPDIDTDVIIAGRYLRTKDRKLWAKHVFEDLDPTLAEKLQGTILITGSNFGCGSSREQAAIALREAGVMGVVAPSFARIFFRNAVNVGLPVIECGCSCRDGVPVKADLEEGYIEIDGSRAVARRLSPRMIAILEAGGLVEFRRSRR